MDLRIIIIGTILAMTALGVALAVGSSDDVPDADGDTDGQIVKWPTVSDETLGNIILTAMDGSQATFRAVATEQGTFLYWVGPDGIIENGIELTKDVGEAHLWKAMFGGDSE